MIERFELPNGRVACLSEPIHPDRAVQLTYTDPTRMSAIAILSATMPSEADRYGALVAADGGRASTSTGSAVRSSGR